MRLLCLAIMVKNEEERAVRTIRTASKYVNHVVVQDTGSTDNTIRMIREFCAKKKLPLRLTQEPFVDFSHNRNKLIKQCYGLSHFLIMLDANAELKNAEQLRSFLNKMVNTNFVTFGCKHQVDNDFQIDGRQAIFYKPAIIRNNFDGIFFESPVHEYITADKAGVYEANNYLETTAFTIYQDKKLDKPSDARFAWDLQQLEAYSKGRPSDPRPMRYLVSTLYNMKRFKDGYEKAVELTPTIDSLVTSNYNDDLYMFYLLTARCNYNAGMDEFHVYYLKTYAYGKRLFDNIEPLYELAKRYVNRGKPELAFIYCKKACEAPEPAGYTSRAMIDYTVYKHHRWQLLFDLSNQLNKKAEFDHASMELYGETGLEVINFDKAAGENVQEQFNKLNPAIQKKLSAFFERN